MSEITLDLTPDLTRIVERAIAEGGYSSASDVVAESLRRLERDLDEDETKLHALREAVAEGLADVEAGRYVDYCPGMVDEIAARVLSRKAP